MSESTNAMRFEITNRLSQDDVVAGIRCVPIEGTAELPYREGFIEFRTIDPNSVRPAQFYCLTDVLQRLDTLNKALDKFGERLVGLMGGLRMLVDGRDFHLIPPVVEEHAESACNLVCDGVHRLFFAREQGLLCNVLWISGVTWPYYGEPNPDGWNDIVPYDDFDHFARSGREKRIYSTAAKAGKPVFRDFNAVFPNVVMRQERGWASS